MNNIINKYFNYFKGGGGCHGGQHQINVGAPMISTMKHIDSQPKKLWFSNDPRWSSFGTRRRSADLRRWCLLPFYFIFQINENYFK